MGELSVTKQWKRLSEIEAPKDPAKFQTGIIGIDDKGYLRQDSPDLVVLAARPGIGKTLLALQIGYKISKDRPVLFFTLEMSEAQLRKRLEKRKHFDPFDAELYIYDRSGLGIAELCETAVRAHSE